MCSKLGKRLKFGNLTVNSFNWWPTGVGHTIRVFCWKNWSI